LLKLWDPINWFVKTATQAEGMFFIGIGEEETQLKMDNIFKLLCSKENDGNSLINSD